MTDWVEVVERVEATFSKQKEDANWLDDILHQMTYTSVPDTCQ